MHAARVVAVAGVSTTPAPAVSAACAATDRIAAARAAARMKDMAMSCSWGR